MKPGQHCYFDTEDNSKELLDSGQSGFLKQMTIAAAVDYNGKWLLTKDREKLISWLSKRKGRVYAHNCKYDLGNLFADRLDDLDFRMVGNRMIWAKWQGIQFMDSLCIWPMSLKKIGDAFKVEKLKMDIHGNEYVTRDVEILRRAMQFAIRFAESYGVAPDEFPATLGGLTVKIWKAMGGENWHDSSAISKAGYYGGRTELFSQGGKGQINYTDINSLYPYTMCLAYPDDALPWCGRNENAMKDLQGYGVASVVLDIPKCRIAPLPVRRDDGSIYYPYGKIEGVWTLAEIRNAIKHGARFDRFVMFEGGCPVLGSMTASYYYRDYIHKIYNNRLNAKSDAEKLFLKLLMNNLYGQLAVGGTVTGTMAIENCVDECGDVVVDGTPFGGKMLVDISFPLQSHVNYLHAAHVTSYARLRLFDFLMKFKNPDDIIYCDTDSIFSFGDLPYKCSMDLGEMKMESTATECRCFAQKVYRFGDKAKAKGIPNRQNNKTGKMLPDEFIENGSVTFEQPFGLRESIAYYNDLKEHGVNDKSRKLSVWRFVEKRKQSDYDKKIFKKGYFFPKKHLTENK